MATSQSYQGDLKNNWHSQLDCLDYLNLHLDYSHRETFYEWSRIPECDEFIGEKRSKHTAVAYKDAIYVFGGDNGKTMLNDLIRFDVKDKSWSRAFTNSFQVPPAPRYHHSAVVHNTSMFIFGGYTGDIHSNSNLTNKNDLYEYNIKIGQWIKWIFIGKAPVPRSAHGAAVFDDKLWIFAGYDGNARLNDMWTISLKNRTMLTLTDQNGEICQGTWEKVDQLGECPPTCCNFPVAVARDCMFVFSGQSGAKITNSLFQFHFSTRFWTRISTDHILRAVPPSPTRRYGHTMVAYDRHLYVFGGAADHTLPNDLHCYDLDTNTWSIVQVTQNSYVPSGRLFHASAVVDGAMYIFGGTIDNNIRSGEIFRFKFSQYPRCTLHDDYGKLLTSKQFVDVKFVIGKEEVIIPGHIAVISARSMWLRERIREAKAEEMENKTARDDTSEKKPSILRVRLEDAVPDAFEMILDYIYSDRIDPTHKIQNPSRNRIVLLIMDVYRLAKQFQMTKLEQLCLHYLETTIDLKNVLEALQYSSSLELNLIKNLCLKFIIKDGNYKEIVMSDEFEDLDKTLMIEIVRQKQEPSSRLYERPVLDPGHTLELDMAAFLKQHLFCDMTLVLQDTNIPVHKAILAARCGYFEAMFRSFMPKDKIQVRIGDVTPSLQAFNSLLKYIYYGNVIMPPEDSLYLYTASHFYSLANNRLQVYCKENLEMNVSPQNVLEILDAANSIPIVTMKNYALDLIVHKYTDVVVLPKFRQLSKELLLDISDAMVRYMNENNAKLK
ncbi:leucine-zipper-like transcriptional regulator 1 isoform X1 [Planococcus citri]|uniref:leucine-zipper-like transcriptional regulator 1 isoform X1 n=1 Tax=Planococcus citri TaxID=170843 RepID=UPI0031F9B638